MIWRRWIAVALSCASCAVAPRDPLAAAQQLADRGDLLSALKIVESAKLGDRGFPAATEMATRLAERMARAHREVATGLFLRSAWQDEQAMRAFRRAEALWPRMPGLADRISSVDRRVPWLAHLSAQAAPGGEGIGLATEPAGKRSALFEIENDGMPVMAAGEGVRASDPAGRQPLPYSGESASTEISLTDAATSEEIALRLSGVEERLGRGEIEDSLLELMVLYRWHATDQRVRQRLSRLLGQRALMRFGRGDVAPAVEDWLRVLEIEPDNRDAQLLLVQARAELAGTSRR